VALYCALQVNGKIPDRDAPRPSKRAKEATQSLHSLENLFNKRQVADLTYLYGLGKITRKELDEAKQNPVTMGRNLRDHYCNTLLACTAMQIWSARSISPEEAVCAEHFHSLACCNWVQMNCSLTPYFHLLEHATPQILRYGPLPSYWLFGYKRGNGKLAKIKTNGHTGGELEVTMMRSWTRNQLVDGLVSNCYILLKIINEHYILDTPTIKYGRQNANGQ
jgi:hypothetical protein